MQRLKRNPEKKNLRILKNKGILLAITGSIAACKSIELIRRLQDHGASVNAVMTKAACQFISPLSVQSVTGSTVATDVFTDPFSHIELTRNADAYLVAPATANTIAKFASGFASDMVSACFMSFKGKTVLAPAMNWRMYEHPALQRNLAYLKSIGVTEAHPEAGELACGEYGVGRMTDVANIIWQLCSAITNKDLAGRKIIVTAGPTREYVDAVRYISNASSGKMGYAIASAALMRGAEVRLISGPASISPPPGAGFVPVEGAQQMMDAVINELDGADALIMAAAVSDFVPVRKHIGKADKHEFNGIKTLLAPDILAHVGRLKKRPLLVGFAAEAGDNVNRAKAKMKSKRADIMVFNDITSAGSGFGCDTNKVVIIDKHGQTGHPLLEKFDVAGLILDKVIRALA